MKLLFVAASMALALGLAAPLAVADAGSAAPAAPGMVLQPGDNIDVQIMGYHDTGGTFPIDAGGDFEMPALPSVHVGGLTDTEAEAKIRDAIWELYRSHPEVNIRVSHRVSVLGQVRAPGLYQVNGSDRVTDVIAMAGGLTDQGSMRRLRVTREDGSDSKGLGSELHSGRTLREIGLRSGDLIYVPAKRALTDWRNWATLASIAGSLALIYDVRHR